MNPSTGGTFDPSSFQKVWMETLSKMGLGGPPAGSGGAEAMNEWGKQMQRAYLDAMAKWSDEYMRSPQFLEQLKSSMEQTLAFRKQMEEFIGKASNQAFSGSLMPGPADVLKAVKDMESRMTSRIAEIAERVAALEGESVPKRKSAAKAKAKTGKKKGGKKAR